MVKYILSLFLCCLCGLVAAQTEDILEDEQRYSSLSTDSITERVGLIPESLDANVDSLLHSWHVQYFTQKEDFCHDDEENVYFPDSIYAQRLKSLPCIIELPYNQVVRDCIDLYAERRRGLVRYMLGMADFYFPIIESVLDKYGLPLELKYLAVVESALNPVALSRVGASGLWQFMLPTGKSYGLEINSLVDERRDPLKATEAACLYFKDMYEIYKDWSLVLAAYNCGPGNVNKAIRRSGGKTGFWEIFSYLPRETRSYVPLFIAANYIMNFYCDHNICPIQTNLPLATDTVMVRKMLHLQQVADVLHLDIEQLRALNPQYKRDIIPGNVRPSVLKLPAAETYAFVSHEDTVYTYRAEDLLANCIALNTSFSGEDKALATRERITHTVKAGENLYTIANIYGVTARDIRKWNGLKSNRVAKGRRLKLYVDNGGVAFAKKNATENTNTTQKQSVKLNADGYISYTVKSGDSLYTISKKYPGLTAKVLQQVNNLTNAMIRPGQILKIPVS